MGGGGWGGGVLSLEKGTDCGLTTGEWWQLQPATAKKKKRGGGCLFIRLSDIKGSCQSQFN